MKKKAFLSGGMLQFVTRIFIFTVLFSVESFSQTTHFVKPIAAGTGDGTSWENASDDLQLMITNSVSGDQVWVAGGTYKPMYPADNIGIIAVGNRDNAFVLKSNVKVFGGFTGSESSLEERVLPAFGDTGAGPYTSILSGDFNGDDTFDENGRAISGNSENAHHVVIAAGSVGAAELNGFTITGGNAAGAGGGVSVNSRVIPRTSGGGIISISSSPILSNLILKGNSGSGSGGIHMQSSSSQISNIVVKGNTASGVGGGGGIVNSGTPVISNAIITHNSAGTNGGAMYNESGSSPVIRNANISYNTANNGAAIYSQLASFTIINSVLSGNTAIVSGGALYNGLNSNPVVINATISGNSAGTSGGGMYSANTAPKIRNSIIWSNVAPTGTNIQNVSSVPVYTNTLIQGSGGSSAWVSSFGTNNGNNIDANPKFTHGGNGDYRLRAPSPAINAGNTSLFTDPQTGEDMGGNARITGGSIDMGAYEYDVEAPEIEIVPGEGGIIYVLKGENGNGSSWENALGEVADALKAAKELNTGTPGTVTQIWAGGGEYLPLYNASNLSGDDYESRDNAFVIVPDVKLYGGFAGNETSPDERVLPLLGEEGENASILSGHYGKVTGSVANNVYHVVVSSGNAGSAVLDGFTITGGNANYPSISFFFMGLIYHLTPESQRKSLKKTQNGKNISNRRTKNVFESVIR